ncbi:hypothetical protein GGR53DRAFT_493116 [Hypoxylon sp. FL1150]|nr:hypothetical protein GGR53DRAFT_493116 [Hypoxylon sp. FL1150]
MHSTTFLQITALTLLTLAATTSASPIDGANAPTVVAPRAAAASTSNVSAGTGTCTYSWSLKGWMIDALVYKLIIDSPQDGGLCGGFWENLQGRADCAGKSQTKCEVKGSVKTISFMVGVGCSADEVLGVLWHATSPRLYGVKCVYRG